MGKPSKDYAVPLWEKANITVYQGLAQIGNAPAEAGAGMKLHHGIFQQVFHIAAENTGQLVEDV